MPHGGFMTDLLLESREWVWLLFAAWLAWRLWRGSRPLPEERGRTPIYEARVGAWIGWLTVSWPLCRARLYPDLLVIGGLRVLSLRLLEDITRVEPGAWLGTGVRLHHRREDLPRWVVLQPAFDHGRLVELLGAALRARERGSTPHPEDPEAPDRPAGPR